MSAGNDVGIEQHNKEIQENLVHWRRKTVLRESYGDFYGEIVRRIDESVPGLIVELGSGLGNIKQYLPNCVLTDIFPNPWLDRVENAYELSFADSSISHLILFDVWHHLEFPGTALHEFHRVLGRGGKLIIFEPAMGLLGLLAFGLFHHEPLCLRSPITWEMPAELKSCSRYYAAQANAWRVFRSRGFSLKLSNWRIADLSYYSGLAYIASGGFRGPQLLPDAVYPVLRRVDNVLTRFSRLASRMLVILEKSEYYG